MDTFMYGQDTLSVNENSDLEQARKEFKNGYNILGLNGKLNTDFLQEFSRIFADIKLLSLFNEINADHSFLYTLKHLEKLSVGTMFNEIDFGQLSQLSTLKMRWNKKSIHNLHKQNTLKDLLVSEFDEENLEHINMLENLSCLSFKTAKCKSLKGVGKLKKLKAISLGVLRSLTDITNIRELDSLEYIEFDSCPKMVDFSALGTAKRLKAIELENCRNLASVSFVRNLPELTQLRLTGSTVVNDFDLMPAKNIKTVYARNKKYNINFESKLDFEDLVTFGDYV